MTDKLMEVKNLKKYFQTKKGLLHAVDDVNFHIDKGETLGLVGESGCGKSTTGRLLIRLLEATDGEVLYNGVNVLALNKAQVKEARKKMQIVFQDPYSSLNPRLTVFELIAERYERRSILITANQPFSGWDNVFPDPGMTVAAIDRLVHHSLAV